MREGPPNEEIEKILKDPRFESHIKYLQGTPLRKEDLIRCRTHEADCAIIMTDQLSANHQMEDYRNILCAFAIKKHKRQEDPFGPSQRICLQIAKPEHKALYYNELLGRNLDD